MEGRSTNWGQRMPPDQRGKLRKPKDKETQQGHLSGVMLVYTRLHNVQTRNSVK